jgi:hypothetical protein
MAMITPLRMTLGDLISSINRGGKQGKRTQKRRKNPKNKKEKIEEFEPREVTKLELGGRERDKIRRKKIRKKKIKGEKTCLIRII